MADGMDKGKNRLSARQVVSLHEHQLHKANGQDFDNYNKQKLFTEMAKLLPDVIEVKQWSETTYGMMIYEAEAVVLPVREYNAMTKELEQLRANVWRLEHILNM